MNDEQNKSENPSNEIKNARTSRLSSKNKILITVLSLILILAVAAGCLVPRLTRGKVVLNCHGLRVREGVVRYLWSYYRYRIAAAYGLPENEAYYRETVDDVTNEERWHDAAMRAVCETIAAVRLFDASGAVISSDDRASLRRAEEALLLATDPAGGTRKTFAREASEWGFTYRDFCDATDLLCKAAHLKEAVWGTGGLLVSEEEKSDFLTSEYLAVHMILLRDNVILTDPVTGDKLADDTGKWKTRPLTEEEKTTRDQAAGVISAALSGEIDRASFSALWLTYSEGAADERTDAFPMTHYLTREASDYPSDYTAAFGRDYPAVLAAALSLEMGQTLAVEEAGIGTFYLFRDEPDTDDLGDSTIFECFRKDFYAHTADFAFAAALRETRDEVTIKAPAFFAALSFGETRPNRTLYVTLP